MREELDPDRSIWHFISLEVLRLRKLSGLTGQALSDIVGCHRSYVSRVENASIHLSIKYAERLDELWKPVIPFARLVRWAEASDDGDWFTGLTWHEARATRHRMWEALLVPGLFQTENYARAALATGMVDDVERAVKTRLARQEAVFGRPDPPRFTVILSWAVLAQPVGDNDVMSEQLSRLLTVAQLPNVNLRILERSARSHVGLDGSFCIMTVDDRDVAFADAPERGRLVTDLGDVQKYAVRYDRISDTAEGIGSTRAILERALETYR
ncbi:helix-turn-helix domain-containing protein [Actinomadura pelletieri]|uniref:helix-turn-helix domain-containing protein n=1 Tax=Actinomadura pelletieri TaxID=111805 RepID=UPI0014777543|nr:helix-turn-helix transcriptional regulator [Actinomadura pelletieri]